MYTGNLVSILSKTWVRKTDDNLSAQINKSINYYLDNALLESYILLSKGGSCEHKVVVLIPPVELQL